MKTAKYLPATRTKTFRAFGGKIPPPPVGVYKMFGEGSFHSAARPSEFGHEFGLPQSLSPPIGANKGLVGR